MTDDVGVTQAERELLPPGVVETHGRRKLLSPDVVEIRGKCCQNITLPAPPSTKTVSYSVDNQCEDGGSITVRDCYPSCLPHLPPRRSACLERALAPHSRPRTHRFVARPIRFSAAESAAESAAKSRGAPSLLSHLAWYLLPSPRRRANWTAFPPRCSLCY